MTRYKTCALLLMLCSGFFTPAAFAGCGNTAPAPSCGSTPSAVFDAQGELWVVFVDAGHVYLARSDDEGASFSPGIKVNVEPEAIYADGENRPVIALGRNGEAYVAWTRQNSKPYSGDIRFTRSVDGGSSFERVVTINDDGLDTSHRFVAMAATSSGLLYLAWLDKRDQVAALAGGKTYTGAALYYTVSADNGESFVANRKIADHSCECCRLALAATEANAVSVLWRHVFEESQVRDHALARLGVDGAEQVQRASFDNWRIEGCPHHGPAMAATADGVHMSWFSNGDARGVLYGKNSLQGGNTSQITTIDARPAGGHPAIAVQGETVTLVWLAFDGSRMNLQLVRSFDGGAYWQHAVSVQSTDGASDHPQLLASNGKLFAAWHSAAEGYRLLPLAALAAPPAGSSQSSGVLP